MGHIRISTSKLVKQTYAQIHSWIRYDMRARLLRRLTSSRKTVKRTVCDATYLQQIKEDTLRNGGIY